MGLINVVVDGAFRQAPAGRLVVLPGGPRKRGYLVRSPAEEQKIRSFLSMFYFAHFYILILGMVLSQGCAHWLVYDWFDRPAHHLLGSLAIFLAIYGLTVILPWAFFSRAYKRALTSFANPADEVSLTGTAPPPWRWVLLLVGFALLILATMLLLTARRFS